MDVTRGLAACGIVVTMFGLAVAQAGCGHQAPAALPAAEVRACHGKYEAWQRGAAAPQLLALDSDTTALTKAGNNWDINGALKWLKASGLAAARVQRTPEPGCADPAGYFGQYLAILIRCGRDTAHGLAGLMDNQYRLESLRGISAQLASELNRTVGRLSRGGVMARLADAVAR